MSFMPDHPLTAAPGQKPSTCGDFHILGGMFLTENTRDTKFTAESNSTACARYEDALSSTDAQLPRQAAAAHISQRLHFRCSRDST